MTDDIEEDDIDEDEIVEDDAEAVWLTDALHRTVWSVEALDYSFCRSGEDDGWLLLRWDAHTGNPVVIAEYPSDHDIYQMVRRAVTAVESDVARRTHREGLDGNPSVYRHGL